MILPSSVSTKGKTYTVTKLGNNFGRNNNTIQSLTIPDTITSLGNACFQSATYLKTINGAFSVTEVGSNIFIGTEWDHNNADNEGYSKFTKVLFRNYSGEETLDFSKSELLGKHR